MYELRLDRVRWYGLRSLLLRLAEGQDLSAADLAAAREYAALVDEAAVDNGGSDV